MRYFHVLRGSAAFNVLVNATEKAVFRGLIVTKLIFLRILFRLFITVVLPSGFQTVNGGIFNDEEWDEGAQLIEELE